MRQNRQPISKKFFGKRNNENLIIHGNNLIVLEALQAKYKNRIKCIYIDPPYNNHESYTHYNDHQSSELWLEKIQKTLHLLKPLLTTDGSIWISIDENEIHYLKVSADKIFNRENFVSTIIWQQRKSRENRRVFSNNHEYILIYAISPKDFRNHINKLPPTSAILNRYKNPDNDQRGLWQSISAHVQSGHATPGQFYQVVAPNGKTHNPPNGRCWVYTEEKMKEEIANNNIWFGKNGNGVPRIKKFLENSNIELTPDSLWLSDSVGTNRMAKKHLLNLFPNQPIFDTPKPEKLLQRIIHIASNKGDYILDSFLGSGTTSAVAHKMGRKYIGIEIEDDVVKLAISRMEKVISGEQGGISKDVDWSGGGGFRFLKSRDIINKL